MGQVIGQSDRTASQPTTEPLHAEEPDGDMMGTLLDLGESAGGPGRRQRAHGKRPYSELL
ncbi:MAG: hypothetical protein U0792_19080 [Gemmataceae bacterium]